MAKEPADLTHKILVDIQDRLGRIEDNQDNFKLRFERIEGTLVTAIDAISSIAAVQEKHSEILNSHSEMLSEMNGRTEVVEGRLNSIDARLARIEKHTGLVKA